MSHNDFLCLKNGTLYDPARGLAGEVQDLWIQAGKIVHSPTDKTSDPKTRNVRTKDLQGLVVMPGGIDIHCHIAGPKVNAARLMQPEDQRNSKPITVPKNMRGGCQCNVPSTFSTGYLYAGLGYTTAFDAAVPPLLSRHVHEQFTDTPILDKGFYALVGNNHYIMQAIKSGETERLHSYLAWLLNTTGAYAPKLVNPGGVEAWKDQRTGNVQGFDTNTGPYGVTPRQIVEQIAFAAHHLDLPHPLHIHCNNLGMPGNWQTTLSTMVSLGDLRGHFTHVQFHSYGGGEAEETSFSSQVSKLANYVNQTPNITVDVGQVLFEKTTSMTSDGALGHFLHNVYGGKWYNHDIESEAGCGVVPIEYKNKSLVHSIQWAAGLEWFLLVENPWQICMSTDHPNGGSFLGYPQIIRLLMDREYRREMLNSCPDEVKKKTILADLTREYTLEEVAIITRAAPARILGLQNKGHLAPGADADITIYLPNKNPQQMFELPKYVFKSGVLVIENGELRNTLAGTMYSTCRDFDTGIIPGLEKWFDEHYSVSLRQFCKP